jgi:flagellar secretion chaperone FliS
MSGYQSLAHRYREVAVKTANPLQLVVMLYDAAICSVQESKEYMNRKDIGGRTRAINKLSAIIAELQACLNLKTGGEIAQSLNRLYDYMRRRVFTANVEQRIEPLTEVEALLENLRSAWKELVALTPGSTPQEEIQEFSQPEMISPKASVAAPSKSFNISA